MWRDIFAMDFRCGGRGWGGMGGLGGSRYMCGCERERGEIYLVYIYE